MIDSALQFYINNIFIYFVAQGCFAQDPMKRLKCEELLMHVYIQKYADRYNDVDRRRIDKHRHSRDIREKQHSTMTVSESLRYLQIYDQNNNKFLYSHILVRHQ